MAHQEQRNFIEKIKSLHLNFFKTKSVLEIGSLNINGTIRDFFTNCNYVGVDVGEGKDVDVVCPGQDYDAPDKFFDVVCSTECFEHNPHWLETFNNMIRMCKDGGLIFFTCATTGRPEHGTTRTTPQNSPFTSEWNYYKNLEESDFTSVINFDSIFDNYIFETNPNTCDLYFCGTTKKNMKKVIDYFLFFNEKELLELRLNLLKDHVDEFIISELNYTHSGNKKDFICKNYIDEIDFDGKVTVLEIEVDDEISPNEIDLYSSSESKSDKEILAWSRERIQRDGLLDIIDEYDDDVVFISGDCDEIINPNFIEYFSNVCRNNHQSTIKIPLILFEGRADKRLYQENQFVPWANSLLMCTAKQLKAGGTPTKMRSNVMNQYPPSWIVEKGEMIQDCGWHFTWMGDNQRRKEKAKSFIHYANLFSVNTLSSDSIKEVTTNNNFSTPYQKKNYPVQLLPKLIFELPRVKNFLLPETNQQHDIKKELSNLYTKFDNQYGEWGWCSKEKYNQIIDCVLETCEEEENPTCVEIGVYGGKSLFSFGVALKQLGKGIVYGIDPWKTEDALIGYDHPSHQQFWGNVDLEKMMNICIDGIHKLNLNNYVSIIRSSSNDSQPIQNINVLHIDGQHTEQLLKDINKYSVNVKVNGYCFIDDIEWSEQTLKAIPLMESLGFEKINNINGCFVYKRKSNIFVASIKSNQKATSVIVDNFYDNPDEVRKFAMEQEYVEGGLGRGFIGRRTVNQFLFPNLKERFEKILDRKIIKWEEYGMNGRFQMAWAGEPLVWHCDSQTYGGMLYLTPDAPYQCGTTLYAHKKTRARTYYDQGWDVEWGKEGGTTHLDGTPWEPVDVLGNVYNRLVIFDGSCIHSASQYFGSDKNNCRLWQMFFFDTL